MILFINACVRRNSRTKQLADRVLAKLGGSVEEVRVWEIPFQAVDEDYLNSRYALLDEGRFDDPMFSHARQFARADRIVIAAPYWDHSFPAALKQYLESICILGVTFAYNEQGLPYSLCRADALWYVTTAGGEILSDAYGFGYVRALARDFFGIGMVREFKAEKLDLVGADVPGIMAEAFARVDAEL